MGIDSIAPFLLNTMRRIIISSSIAANTMSVKVKPRKFFLSTKRKMIIAAAKNTPKRSAVPQCATSCRLIISVEGISTVVIIHATPA